MAVLVEGMEMPEDGRYILCITHDSSGNVHWVFQNEDTYEFLKHGLVKELQPHGRLIDADRLLSERMKRTYYHLPNGDTAIPIIDIEYAPTIISKEEGKNEANL